MSDKVSHAPIRAHVKPTGTRFLTFSKSKETGYEQVSTLLSLLLLLNLVRIEPSLNLVPYFISSHSLHTPVLSEEQDYAVDMMLNP